jgi:hypothetical protein
LYRITSESGTNSPRISTYLLTGILSLVRADAIVLSFLLFFFAFILTKDKKKVVLFSIVTLAIPAIQIGFRLLYYGDILPNTAYLKTANWVGKYIYGIQYVFDFIKNYLVFFILIGLYLVGRRTHLRERTPFIALVLILCIYLVYIAYIGGDAFLDFRFMVPIIPVLLGLAFIGLEQLKLSQGITYIIVISAYLFMPLLVDYNSVAYSRNADRGNVLIGLLINKNTPKSARVADFWAGSVFYFSNRYGIDMLGKTDPFIAHMPPASNGTKPGHNKFDFDYSIGELRPDIVIAIFKLPVSEEAMRTDATGDWAFTGDLYFNSTFKNHCLPNPIALDTWRSIFICDWSPLLNGRNNWSPVDNATAK